MNQSQLVTIISGLRTNNYTTVAATALLGYEITITFDQEVKLIWRSSWTFPKILYLCIRYYSFIFLVLNLFVSTNTSLSVKFCKPFTQFESWGVTSFAQVVDLLIITRIYVLYNRTCHMRIILAMLWLTQITTALTLIGLGLGRNVMPNPLPDLLSGCFYASLKYKFLISDWIQASVFQAIYISFTLVKFWEFSRTIGTKNMTPLLQIFFRDGAGYFCLILSVMLVNIFLEKFGSLVLSGSGTMWFMSTSSIIACRMVLNIRDICAPGTLLPSEAWSLSFALGPLETGHSKNKETDAEQLSRRRHTAPQ